MNMIEYGLWHGWKVSTNNANHIHNMCSFIFNNSEIRFIILKEHHTFFSSYSSCMVTICVFRNSVALLQAAYSASDKVEHRLSPGILWKRIYFSHFCSTITIRCTHRVKVWRINFGSQTNYTHRKKKQNAPTNTVEMHNSE